MTINEIKQKLSGPEYEFARIDPRIANNCIFAVIAGSHAYGTATENSDIDLRGCILNRSADLLGRKPVKSIIDEATDSVFHPFNKTIDLLKDCNPNMIELLGCPAENYVHMTTIGQELLDHRDMFLSQLVINKFQGYAAKQMKIIASSEIKTKPREKQCKELAALVRLYLTAIDILEKQEIITCRKQEAELLLAIRRGEYLTENPTAYGQLYRDEYRTIVEELSARFKYAAENTMLPKYPDEDAIHEFQVSVNRRAIDDNFVPAVLEYTRI